MHGLSFFARKTAFIMKRKSDTQEHGNGPCRLVARETGLMDSLRWAITYISLFFFRKFYLPYNEGEWNSLGYARR